MKSYLLVLIIALSISGCKRPDETIKKPNTETIKTRFLQRRKQYGNQGRKPLKTLDDATAGNNRKRPGGFQGPLSSSPSA